MLIIAKKVHLARLAAGIAALTLLLGFAGAGVSLAQHIHIVETSSILAPTQVSQKSVKQNEDRVAYLEHRGWVVNEEPVSVEEIRIPDTFDSSYDEYLSLQESQGFNLRACAGETIKRYTYQVKNYPGLENNIWASLLVHKKTVVGGEVYSCEGDGFTQGLDYPACTDHKCKRDKL